MKHTYGPQSLGMNILVPSKEKLWGKKKNGKAGIFCRPIRKGL